MTKYPSVVAELLASIEGERESEALPIEEADLRMQSVDPTTSIAIAHALPANAS